MSALNVVSKLEPNIKVADVEVLIIIERLFLPPNGIEYPGRKDKEWLEEALVELKFNSAVIEVLLAILIINLLSPLTSI